VPESEHIIVHWLDRPVDPASDHILGPLGAPITLVEYGSYACPHCRAANERIAQVREQLGDRLRYVFRHRPLTGVPLARTAAELVEHASTPEQFWKAHIALMTRSGALLEEDVTSVENDLRLSGEAPAEASEAHARARARVDIDEQSARRSGVTLTPTFFINGRRYDGPWDESSFADAMLGSLGHRVRAAALDFASWAPSAGVLLLLASVVAVALTSSAWGPAFTRLWQQPWGVTLSGSSFLMPLIEWINAGLLTVFFLVVGLEIKRELTVGHLATPRSAALPVAAAIGGMLVPAMLYRLLTSGTRWAQGWGVPMPTDTAFAVAILVMMGRRVPVELRVFLTAAAIVDDIVTIVVVALFYSKEVDFGYLAAAAGLVLVLALLNWARVYKVTPYLLVGVLLWLSIHAGGLHATLAGVLLALFIPTRPPANLDALRIQAGSIMKAEAERTGEVLRRGPSQPTMRALDAIHDRLESPADRMLRHVAPRSSYVVLPMFALANAGVTFSSALLAARGPLALAILLGLTVGKPVGLMLGSWLTVRLGWASKPQDYSWTQLLGAGAVAGIGFTMSLFIAGQSFPAPEDFAVAKLAVFAASLVSGLIGVAILWSASRQADASATMTVPEQG
jgi:NhaA family Na+:H+ antiporter